MVYVNWTIQAKDDLKNIAQFIAKDSIKQAKLQVLRIRTRVKILYAQNKAGKYVQDADHHNIRELIEGNYRIIYKILYEDRIDILTVYHTKRDLNKLHL